jgi:hypothetical protein
MDTTATTTINSPNTKGDTMTDTTKTTTQPTCGQNLGMSSRNVAVGDWIDGLEVAEVFIPHGARSRQFIFADGSMTEVKSSQRVRFFRPNGSPDRTTTVLSVAALDRHAAMFASRFAIASA